MPALRPADVNGTIDYRLLERVLERAQADERWERFAERVFAATDDLQREEGAAPLTLVVPLNTP